MELPQSFRDNLVDEMDQFLEAYSTSPDPEGVVSYVIELLETFADDEGIDDIVATLEEESALDGTLQEVLESEMTSNDEFEYTGEEVVSLLEHVCAIEWIEGLDEDEDEDLDEDEEDVVDEDDA